MEQHALNIFIWLSYTRSYLPAYEVTSATTIFTATRRLNLLILPPFARFVINMPADETASKLLLVVVRACSPFVRAHQFTFDYYFHLRKSSRGQRRRRKNTERRTLWKHFSNWTMLRGSVDSQCEEKF